MKNTGFTTFSIFDKTVKFRTQTGTILTFCLRTTIINTRDEKSWYPGVPLVMGMDCIGKKPGKPVTAAETRAVVHVSAGRARGGTRGSGVVQHGAYPGGAPWYGSGYTP